VKIGYKLFAEAFSPQELVAQAVRAEEAGFDFVEISDHYHPWLFSHDHSGFAWSILGTIAARTERIELATGVTCPFLRYHPAIVAQAAATTALLCDGRFTLGVGAGERLNEHVVGRGWPAAGVRHEMLREALGHGRGRGRRVGARPDPVRPHGLEGAVGAAESGQLRGRHRLGHPRRRPRRGRLRPRPAPPPEGRPAVRRRRLRPPRPAERPDPDGFFEFFARDLAEPLRALDRS
jgi:alkanesulfonate monooxygenase SsuD/methylene tetrahydromethanopterin reductase-like flavin-dependent oxidoreductase (luciferase family)